MGAPTIRGPHHLCLREQKMPASGLEVCGWNFRQADYAATDGN
jgi:hypothetical protein